MRVRHKETIAQRDVLEVRHHEIPTDASGAGAPAIVSTRRYQEGGLTWRRMLRGIAIAEAVGLVTLVIAASAYGMSTFYPFPISALVFCVGAALIPRMTKPGVITTLVAASLTLLFFGLGFFGWTGVFYPTSWFQMVFAVTSTLLPIAAIVAAIATLRRKEGPDGARIPSLVVGGLSAAIALTGIVGSVASSDPTRLPGDVTLTASDFEFEQQKLTAHGGDVTIYFANKDPFAHNVEIKGQGASDDAGGRSSIRHVFEGLSAGTYEYFCNIHTDMKGTLTVT